MEESEYKQRMDTLEKEKEEVEEQLKTIEDMVNIFNQIFVLLQLFKVVTFPLVKSIGSEINIHHFLFVNIRANCAPKLYEFNCFVTTHCVTVLCKKIQIHRGFVPT